MDKDTREVILPSIRKEFYALRNGMIADTLRKGGLEQKYVFGLQLPQIKDISVKFRPDTESDAADLARVLWADRECREARLLACHMMPPALIGRNEASEWASDVRTREEADIIAFRLLRYVPFAAEIVESLSVSDDSLKKYAAEAIRRFL